MYSVSEAYKTAIAAPSRQFVLDGDMRLQSGVYIPITDNNVVGELSISSQMMSGSSADTEIDIGAICAASLSMTFCCGDYSAEDFGDAFIRLMVRLKLEDGSFEPVKMGVFYIAPETIRRVKKQITFTAYDKMKLLDFQLTDSMRMHMNGMTAYQATKYLCGLVKINLSQTAATVEAFPNGDIPLDFSSAVMETARDVIMWCGQMMGCFTRINRDGLLEFVQIKSEIDPGTNMIIPVREIAANHRFDTKFADSVIKITALTMKRYDGKFSKAKYTGTTSKRSLELELEQNPLVLTQTAKSVGEVLKSMLEVLCMAYFRPFSSAIANDPALDAGDYVRLRGGSIDTKRGYATGIITHNVWRYRGRQDIVNVGSAPVLSQIEEEPIALMALSDEAAAISENTEEAEEITYTQPKPQSQKLAGYGNVPAHQTYTTAIAFNQGGFDLTFSDGANIYTNAFTVTEDGSGNITKITNTTAGREIEVTYS